MEVSVPQLVFGASAFSVLCLATVLALRGRLGAALGELREKWATSLLRGAINPGAYYFVLFSAYDRLPAQVAQPINYSWAIVLTLLSIPFLGQRLTARSGGGIVVGYLGVIVVSLAGLRASGSLDAWGLILALLSSFIWASYWLVATRDEREPTAGTFQNFLMALPFLGLWAWLSGDGLPTGGRAWLGLAYVGAFEMGITFVLWQKALQSTTSVARVTAVVYLSPFLSLGLIYLVLAEPFNPLVFVGLGLIVVGVVLQDSPT